MRREQYSRSLLRASDQILLRDSEKTSQRSVYNLCSNDKVYSQKISSKKLKVIALKSKYSTELK
jgi:hypothetical protein